MVVLWRGDRFLNFIFQGFKRKEKLKKMSDEKQESRASREEFREAVENGVVLGKVLVEAEDGYASKKIDVVFNLMNRYPRYRDVFTRIFQKDSHWMSESTRRLFRQYMERYGIEVKGF